MSRQVWLHLTVVASIASSSFDAFAAPPTLPKRHLEVITKQVVPAYQAGDLMMLLKSLSPLVARLDDERVRLADEVLHKHDLPSAGDLLGDVRRMLVEQGLGRDLPKPKLRELAIVAPVLQGRIDKTLAELRDHPAMADPMPRFKKPSDYQELFWKIHVADNELTNALALAEYCGEMFKRNAARRNLKSLDADQALAIEVDYAVVAVRIRQLQQELWERSLELRLDRLTAAVHILELNALDEERLFAAHAVAVDTRLLEEFLQSGAKPGRARLQDPLLADEMTALISRGRELGGELIDKSVLLFDGLHWWLRGRYGRGSDGWGLFKGEFALASPEAMFRLTMPREPTEAASLARQGVGMYPVDRRHAYTWAWEDRPIPFRKIEGNFT